MITLGDCNGCAGVCDRVAFSNSATGMPARPAEIVGSATEGNPIAFWVNRYPNCFIYDGDPTTYEANEEHPATDIIPEDQYYFDAGARSFWQNQSGTMTAVATPSWFKVGAITGTVKIQLPTCECTAHIITGTADVPFSFASGDDTSVAVSLTTTCPGPPIFWGCRDQPGGVEVATLYFEDVSATGGCVTTGHAAQGVVTCTHPLPHPNWGEFPYWYACYSAVYTPSYGFGEFEIYVELNGQWIARCKQGDGNRYLRFEYEKAVDGEVTVAQQVEYFQHGNVIKELRWVGSNPAPLGYPYIDANIRLYNTPSLWQPPATAASYPFNTVPQPARIWTGTNHTLSASMNFIWPGTGGVDFLWSNGYSSADGAPTFATALVITEAELADAGTYSVTATNAFSDTATSPDAELEVIESATLTPTSFSLSYTGPEGGDGTEAVVETASLSGATSSLPLDATAADAYVAQVEAAFPDSGGYFIWDGVLPEYTWKIRATQDGFEDPAFDSTKTYEYTGATLPSAPYNPDDWTETADTGFDFEQVADPLYTQECGPFEGGACNSATLSIGFNEVGRYGYIAKRNVSIDASNSMTGNPYPCRVFVTVDPDAEEDITDSTKYIEVTSVGGTTGEVTRQFGFRPEYINAPYCGPTPSGVFICHPGLTSDPCA